MAVFRLAVTSTLLGPVLRATTRRRLITPEARFSVPNPNLSSIRFNFSFPQARIEASASWFSRRELGTHLPFLTAIASSRIFSKLPSDFTDSCEAVSLHSSYSTMAPSKSLGKRNSKRKKSNAKPVLDETKLQQAISQLPPRFTPEELADAITLQEDPLVCFHLFNWASQQPRFRHDVCSYHNAIRKLGAAKMYKEMDDIVNQVLAVHHIGNENLYNSIVFYFTQARKLIRAVNIFKHMRSSRNLECRPTVRTYHILFKALLGRGNNSYTSHMYMDTMRSLFKQMVDDGIEPDVFALNCMIRGYVLSLHVNDALRIFHQMNAVYDCQPNAYSYDYLIHGLCVQGRTINARELFEEMKAKGFVPNGKSYNSLVNALAISGAIDDAVNCLWEMIENGRLVDLITCKTVLDEFCRRGKYGEATRLLEMLREKKLVDGDAYKKLVNVLHSDS
ncbi:PREDICTED: pentatricopeptide repeat-containing protein At2g27800, mitochondrial isoform X2 [Tarenaya hassleriana]|uniref:pentatricopeptide repeat-containing protein At2g27800, mitochondrial isoform X2 n=1 Tax=Tarenaya hassleriana TaxID=28532 RepID=UPI00053CA5EF|nr:PREDICTED: pentatricopeptide repeat-containing protein At2g27800, mitochondrial isoform X2 [Tarenaya hassleriana]